VSTTPDTTLAFSGAYSPPAPGAVPAINFGAPAPSGPPANVTGTLAAVHAAPTLHASLHTVYTAQLAASAYTPVLHATASYDSRTSRPLTHSSIPNWQAGAPVQRPRSSTATATAPATTAPWASTLPLTRASTAVWQTSQAPQALRTSVRSRVANLPPLHQANAVAYQQALCQIGTVQGIAFFQLLPSPIARIVPWQATIATDARRIASTHRQLLPKPRHANPLWQAAIASVRSLRTAHAQGIATPRPVRIPWQRARQPAHGREATPIAPPPAPFAPHYLLNFKCLCTRPSPLSVLLNFGLYPCPEAGPQTPSALQSILPARFYMSIHNLSAQRLPDLAEIPLFDATLSADAGSFAWSFSASGPDSLFGLLAPTMTAGAGVSAGGGAAIPQQIRITLDGFDWVFAVESLKRTHSFGKHTVSISGRSLTALIGQPWLRDTTRTAADPNATATTAQQFAEQALDLSGVALDWGLIDWLIPAPAYSHIGTPLSAVQYLTESVGGYLQSHRNLPTLQARHPYPPMPDGSPGGPWNWGIGAPDIELAPDAIITSGIERKDGPDLNAAWVSGTTQGVLAQIKRTGTAGDKSAPLQTHPLITHADAALQKGLSILGKAGAQYSVALELPILTGAGQPGVIDVGRLVQINDATPWRARVKSVQVNASMPTARQTITLERHLS
jgi:hypothetical protein